MIRALLEDLKNAVLGIAAVALITAVLLALFVGSLVLQLFMFEDIRVKDYLNTTWVCEQPALTVTIDDRGWSFGEAAVDGKLLKLQFSGIGRTSRYTVCIINDAGEQEEDVAVAELSIDEKKRQMRMEIEREDDPYILQLNCVGDFTPLGRPLTPFGRKVVAGGGIAAGLLALILGITAAVRRRRRA